MTNAITNSILKSSAIGVMAIALLFGMMAPSAQAQSSTTSEAALQAQITQLMQILASLQAQAGIRQTPEGGFADQAITTGSRVKTSAVLRVRSDASTQANLISTVPANTIGTVTSGPRNANGYTWWLVNYNNGVQGWSAANWLQAMVDTTTTASSVDVTVESVSNHKNPIVAGTAYNTDTVGFSVQGASGDKVYGSGQVVVIDNQWEHRITANLPSGSYRLDVYVNGVRTTYSRFSIETADDDNGIAVEFEDSEALSRENVETNRGDDEGRYSIEVEITALDSDIYIPVGDYGNAPNTGFTYNIINSDGEVLGVSSRDVDSGTMVFTSRAPKYSNQYVIREGETEDFTVTVIVNPVRKDFYKMRLDKIRYYTDGAKQASLLEFDVNNQDFETEYVLVDGTGVQQGEVSSESEEVAFPGENEFACDRTKTASYSNGRVACYGMWDHGEKFGGEQHMCSNSGSRLGCQVKVPSCTSGYAKATKFYSSSNLSQLTGSTLRTVLTNLDVNEITLEEGIIGLWEYTCGAAPSTSEAGLQNSVDSLLEYVDKLNSSLESKADQVVSSPEKNIFACDRSQQQKHQLGSLACYGMWDYGNDFGGDKYMCGSYAGKTGCEIKAPVCASGYATATKYLSNSQLKNLTGSPLLSVLAYLNVNEATMEDGIAGLWEYTCTNQGQVLGASTSSVYQTAIAALAELQIAITSR